MKQTSTQPSFHQLSNADPIYSLYLNEVEQRGHSYINVISRFPGITGGHLPADAISQLLIRLACNPSIFSYFQEEDPIGVVKRLVEADLNDVETDYLYDFIDDITLNVRMKNSEMYQARKDTLLDQIKIICRPTKEDEAQKFDSILKQLEEYVVTFYYLRKIGYIYEFSRVPPKEDVPLN